MKNKLSIIVLFIFIGFIVFIMFNNISTSSSQELQKEIDKGGIISTLYGKGK